MEIIETYSTEKEGNDCYITNEISMVKINGDYMVVESKKYSGWMGIDNNVTVYNDNYDCVKARMVYEKLIKEIA